MSERLITDIPLSPDFIPEPGAALTEEQVHEVAEAVERRIIHSRDQVPPKIDCLVVLGKNLGQGIWNKQTAQEIPYNLSLDSKINTRAAGELYEPGRKILLSGGHTIGEGFPSQPEAAKRFLQDIYPDIPDEDILIDDQGFDTAKSAEYLAHLAKDGKFKHFAAVSEAFHLVYTYPLFRQYGAPELALIASEDIVAETNEQFAKIIDIWKNSKRVDGEVDYAYNTRLAKVLTTDVRGAETRERTQSRVE